MLDRVPLVALTASALIASCASDPKAPAEAVPEASGASVSIAEALDLDGDGQVERYEAASAAMALADAGTDVDEAARQRGAMSLSEDSLTFTVDGADARVEGVIDARSHGRLLEILLEHRDVSELVLARVEESADPLVAMRLARAIEAAALSTRVPAEGVLTGNAVQLLAAGASRVVEPGARVAVRTADGELRWLDDATLEATGLRTEVSGLELLGTGSTASLRGLSAVNGDAAWATGSGATVLRTTDGGATWANVAPASIEGLDVRDVYALSPQVAWIMTAGPAEASRILFTSDGGATWTEQHRETEPEAFLDGLDLWEPGRGLCYGDPMSDGRFRVLLTEDGSTWTPSTTGPIAMESGEASFAASGTGVRALGLQRAWICTGATGTTARVFSTSDAGATWTAADAPVAAAGQGAGAFSVAFSPDGRGVLVGGDYLERERGGTQNAAWSDDFGATWNACEVGPRGQRAGSAALGPGVFLATGQTGTDITRDGGKTWRAFSSEGFHCVDVSPIDGTVWFAGPRGRVARLR
ncbi:MAG: hypothetical protein AAF957_08390 [Planctomycetota bacterium]